MARQLYDYWFVQFDFPDENGRPYKSSGGKMVWNKQLKREIPYGWEITRLDELTNIFTGKKDVSKVTPGEYKFFSCAPDPILSSEFIFDGQAILVSGNGSYTGRVSFYNGKGDLYQRAYACMLKEGINDIMSYLYLTMKVLFEPYHSGGKHGSSIPYIVMEDLAGFVFPYSKQITMNFAKIVNPIFNQFAPSDNMAHEQIESLRNMLLPLLMNGQVSVMPQEVNCDLSHD
ncbi:MAG: restriction endonuclease subunit S [Muribaculaceae bacterium]|nr:restriction endonuclease subunit S [Muribaculaceae bacterium]